MRRLSLTFAVVITVSVIGPAAAGPPRPLTPDDLFRIEEVGEVAIAPDGTEAAVVIRRPATPGHGHGRPLLLGGDRSDVFLAPVAGGEPTRLTDGAADGSGFWRPLWSPDGRRLALLSTRGGDNVRLFVWERETGRVRRLTDDGVDVWAAVDPATHAPFVWLDSKRLLCAFAAPGEAPTAFTLDTPTRRGAAAAWARAERGAEPTASVLDTGPGRPIKTPRGRLAVVDADAGSALTLAEGAVVEAAASPDGRHAAVVVEAAKLSPREGRPLAAVTDRSPSRLGLVDLSGRAGVRWVGSVPDPKTKIRRMQLTWSADGSQVAVLSQPAPDADRADALFLARLDGSARRAGGPDFRVSATARVGNRLLALGHRGNAPARDDWWMINPSDEAAAPTLLTVALPAVPEAWHAVGGGAALGVAAGKVWRLDAAAGTCEEVRLEGGRKASRIVRPSGETVSELLVECRPLAGASSGDLLRVPADRAGGQTVLPRPAPAARLVEYGAGAAAMFTAVTPVGTTVWSSSGDTGSFARPFALNGFLADVADAAFRVIAYRGSDGGPLKAHLLLPPGHRDGDRHPTVVWVYPGTALGDQREELLQKNSRHSMNLALLAARGYAVLVPSMPLGPEGKAADPLTELPKGVLPAVDKVVELGLADPSRLAVLGHSYGGYAVYGLLTQTTRFRAGIAMAGITDLVALYGTLDARVRYEAEPFHNFFGPTWSEVGQGRMGAAPWADPDRYRRNSPITYVDRVRTPLLMVHGDADFVPIQQAEEFYASLLRLGRRARFVRYWGEGHVFESPANVRDLWGRVYAWLDEQLGPTPANKRPTGSNGR